MKRFYPETVPAFTYEPSPDDFEIRSIGTGDYGEGVVALRPFAAGSIVFAFTGFYTSEITQFSLTVRPGLHLHDPYFMGKILHRCDPNCHVDMSKRQFIALRDIFPNDLVTMNYEQTEARLYKPFHCNCGNEPCVGFASERLISGFETEDE